MNNRQAKKHVAKLAKQFRDRNGLDAQYDWDKTKLRSEEVHDATHIYTKLGVSPGEEILIISFQLGLIGYSWYEIHKYWEISENLSYFPGWEKVRDWFMKSLQSHPSWLLVMNNKYSVIELL
jgi:hypothetical protein